MTSVAVELQEGGVAIDTMARKYGYCLRDAFNRAFKALHGINPSEVKDYRHSLKAWRKFLSCIYRYRTVSQSITGYLGQDLYGSRSGKPDNNHSPDSILFSVSLYPKDTIILI